ncbi:MAG: YtxH domain-containing protein [Acidobacteria bacterium]|nr:YtxH domain-containing protein [Acidobacteriota bacterium]
MEDSTNKLSFFFLGLGIGVAVGILFAPKSGQETRELIRSKADEGKDYLKRRGETLRDSATEAIEKGKSAITRQKEQLAAAVEAGRQAYRETVAGAEEPAEPRGI